MPVSLAEAQRKGWRWDGLQMEELGFLSWAWSSTCESFYITSPCALFYPLRNKRFIIWGCKISCERTFRAWRAPWTHFLHHSAPHFTDKENYGWGNWLPESMKLGSGRAVRVTAESRLSSSLSLFILFNICCLKHCINLNVFITALVYYCSITDHSSLTLKNNTHLSAPSSVGQKSKQGITGSSASGLRRKTLVEIRPSTGLCYELQLRSSFWLIKAVGGIHFLVVVGLRSLFSCWLSARVALSS